MEESIKIFERLYDEYVDMIFRYLAGRLGDRERAKELTHEVFVRLWSQLQKGETIVYEKAFLYTIAKRLFINEIRTPERQLSLDTLSEEHDFEPRDGEATPETVAEFTEIWRHVTQLPPAAQELLRLRYQDGLSVQDIAHIYDARENAVSMRLQRALTALRHIYSPPTSPTP